MSAGYYSSAAPAPNYYDGSATTHTVDVSGQVSTGTIVAVLVCIVVGIALLYWVTQFCLMYCFYKLDPIDRPIRIYDGNQNNCNDLCCIYTNKSIIRHFCPDILTKNDSGNTPVFLNMKPTQVMGVVQTTASRWSALPFPMRLANIQEEEPYDDEQGLISPHRRASSSFSMFDAFV